jgi:hypothetical protein
MDFLNSEWERGFYVLIALIALATFVIFAWFARRYIRPYGFARYAGCTLPLLEQCRDAHTISKRQESGVVLLLSVGASSLAAGATATNMTQYVLFGVFWGIFWFLLFSKLDASILSSMDGLSPKMNVEGESRSEKWKRLAKAYSKTVATYGFRAGLVFFIATINTGAVVDFAFKNDIERAIAARAVEMVRPYEAGLSAARGKYGKMVEDWENHLQKERNVYQQWLDAKRPEEAARVLAQLDRKQAEYEKIKVSGVEAKALADAVSGLADAKRRAQETVGPEERVRIMKDLADKNRSIKVIFILIFIVEMAAFIVKLFRGKDEYDRLVTEYRTRVEDTTKPFEPVAPVTPFVPPAPQPQDPGDFQDTEAGFPGSPQVR